MKTSNYTQKGEEKEYYAFVLRNKPEVYKQEIIPFIKEFHLNKVRVKCQSKQDADIVFGDVVYSCQMYKFCKVELKRVSDLDIFDIIITQ